MSTLVKELKLRIDDYGPNDDLKTAIDTYFSFAVDYMRGRTDHLVHTRHYL